ncbi:MAG: hypothetical protein ACTHN5_06905, partial [Phycisphaerae bacterium]
GSVMAMLGEEVRGVSVWKGGLILGAMARDSGYRRATGTEGALSGGVGRGPARWWLVGGFVGVALVVVGLVAGSVAVSVMQTWLYGLLAVPVWVSAGVLGAGLTKPFGGVWEGSPWPDLFRAVVAEALGLGALSLGMLGLGAVHLVDPPWVVLVLMGAAVGVGIVPAREFWRGFDWSPLREGWTRGEWMILLGAVPVGMLMIAVTFPPGTLWGSEGRGYDVLEYHLEMPREYGATNSAMPVGHNVYSYLPANVEMLYLMEMQGGRFAGGIGGGPAGGSDYLFGVFAAQMTHAFLALLAVLAIGVAPIRLGAVGRVVGMVSVLAVPWTIVTGSLAYDEWGMMVCGVLAIAMALSGQWSVVSGQKGEERRQTREGILVGILLGLAVGCKMTAGVFFAVPVGVILLLRGRWKGALVAAGVALAVYAPWGIRAAVESGGNPVFPLAARVLPRDGWTAAQVERFERGHTALVGEQSCVGRAGALWRESVLNEQWSPGWAWIYTLVRERPPGEWWKHVGVMWVVVPLAVVLAFLRGVGKAGDSRGRELGMVVVILVFQVGAWMFFTHLQSRFLLPVGGPLAWLFGLGVEGAERGVVMSTLRVLVATVVGVVALCTVFLLLPEAGLLGGVQAVGNQKEAVAPPVGELFTRVVNVAAAVEKPAEGAGGAVMPEGKILVEGNAAVLFWEGEIFYNTTFDRNLLGEELRAGGAAGAAKWLRDSGFNYVGSDWAEVERLRRTYGFDEAITPAAVEGLVGAGVGRVEEAGVPRSLTILRVKGVESGAGAGGGG